MDDNKKDLPASSARGEASRVFDEPPGILGEPLDLPDPRLNQLHQPPACSSTVDVLQSHPLRLNPFRDEIVPPQPTQDDALRDLFDLNSQGVEIGRTDRALMPPITPSPQMVPAQLPLDPDSLDTPLSPRTTMDQSSMLSTQDTETKSSSDEAMDLDPDGDTDESGKFVEQLDSGVASTAQSPDNMPLSQGHGNMRGIQEMMEQSMAAPSKPSMDLKSESPGQMQVVGHRDMPIGTQTQEQSIATASQQTGGIEVNTAGQSQSLHQSEMAMYYQLLGQSTSAPMSPAANHHGQQQALGHHNMQTGRQPLEQSMTASSQASMGPSGDLSGQHQPRGGIRDSVQGDQSSLAGDIQRERLLEALFLSETQRLSEVLARRPAALEQYFGVANRGGQTVAGQSSVAGGERNVPGGVQNERLSQIFARQHSQATRQGPPPPFPMAQAVAPGLAMAPPAPSTNAVPFGPALGSAPSASQNMATPATSQPSAQSSLNTIDTTLQRAVQQLNSSTKQVLPNVPARTTDAWIVQHHIDINTADPRSFHAMWIGQAYSFDAAVEKMKDCLHVDPPLAGDLEQFKRETPLKRITDPRGEGLGMGYMFLGAESGRMRRIWTRPWSG
ncbi:hypothetical protein M409DRAFT_52242 [Zasmidium cellare ATCC 36951]|uniref:Uncharacterized protein n=1 Tax=Zasmidium cellare ATCC 36951 TaxID=1080233 RepID=A0A6A6CRN2_ZASCE|nr:uncharacterized protein M409DRAFT_52242 [Zasmidium cellare ATCC 36951]KAF2169735.1 hypothetical protein M409DRAFT_52242 [Zasmidium cellare ATCC 36951]